MKNQIRTILIVSVVFFLVIAFMWQVTTWIVIGGDYKPVNRNFLNLQENGTASSSSASLLFFHNEYPEGKQSGIEIISHGERIATNGNLIIIPESGERIIYPQLKNKLTVDSTGQLLAELFFEEIDFTCFIKISLLHNSFRLGVHSERPIPRSLAGKLYFSMEFFPVYYLGRYFSMDEKMGIISGSSNNGSGDSQNKFKALAEGTNLILAPEDPLKKISITREKGKLYLINQGPFTQRNSLAVESEIQAGKAGEVLAWDVKINQVKGWQREPVILYSQVGYHPQQQKKILIELPRNEQYVEKTDLLKLESGGRWRRVFSMNTVYKGQFLRYYYYEADVSNIREEGLYKIVFKDEETRPFLIADNVYSTKLWQPGLGIFFPVMMEGVNFQDVHQGGSFETYPGKSEKAFRVKTPDDKNRKGTSSDPPERFDRMTRGGWMNRVDTEEKLSSNINAVYRLGLTSLLFDPGDDNTYINPEKGLVTLFEPDGKPDILQQIEHGAVFLLQNHISEQDYGIIKALAVCSMALHKFNPELSDKCMTTAVESWKYQIIKEPLPSNEIKSNPKNQMAEKISAAAELYLLTGDQEYKKILNDLLPDIEDHFFETAGSVSRIYEAMDLRFQELYRIMAGNYLNNKLKEVDKSPFSVPVDLGKEGITSDILEYAVNLYMLQLIFPEMIDPEYIYDALSYVFGKHPCSNVSLVSGIGNRSVMTASGRNAAEIPDLPGAVFPGPVLIKPDFPELMKNRSFQSQRSAYDIAATASYIFLVLAVDDLLN